MSIIAASEVVPDADALGMRAFTTTRASGSFGVMTDESVREVLGRWDRLRGELRTGGARFATATQVHGAEIIVHHPGWEGWLRGSEADGHLAMDRGTALVVAVADCVPVFITHPSGATALLHSGWRGTAARIVERAISALAHRGVPPAELRVHTGPAICGQCYEVSGDVYAQLTGRHPGQPSTIDLRGLIADHARAMGVRHISTSASCTRCDNGQFYSHRAGDSGRQVSVLIADCS